MGQTALPPSILPRVSALVRMLNSPLDTEAIGAARALGRTLASAGCDFHDLADRIEHGLEQAVCPPQPSPASQATRAGAPRDSVTWKAAQRRAVAERLRKGLHTRAKLRNAADLADAQATPIRCHFCGDRLDDDRPVVAVLTGRPKSPLWLHAGACHAAHFRRHTDRVDAFMARAGFGPGPDAPAPDQEDQQP